MSPATAAPLVVRGLAQAASGSGHAAASKAASPVASVVPLAVPAGVAGGGSAERLAPLATLGRGLGASAASRQRRPRRLRRGVIGVAVAAFAATSAVLYLRRILAAPAALTVPARAAPVARTVASTPQASGTSADAALAQLATAALARIEPLAQQVSSGGIIANFGKEAERLLHDLEEEALSEVDGASATALVSAVDGALNSLFLQQLELLRARVAARFQAAARVADLNRTAEPFRQVPLTLQKPRRLASFVKRRRWRARVGASRPTAWCCAVRFAVKHTARSSSSRRDGAQSRRSGRREMSSDTCSGSWTASAKACAAWAVRARGCFGPPTSSRTRH
eukprot:TRINITY_DN11749_c0_g1_i1.p1 TRINITY_DN11749_c0_g1~~TRINITY_DN11749_c0_g1_i1.p1  ORF type:complete len:363 (-),score=69.37 TRINITY_DN11749_c0_g1_i1:174-1187(-)